MSEGPGSPGVTLVRWIGLAMGLPALIAVMLLGKDTLMVVERVNESALQRDAMALERGLKLLGELNAAEVIAQGLRSTALRDLVPSERVDRMRETFASAALSSEALQETIIVDAEGQVVLSSAREGAPASEQTPALIAAAAQPIERARTLYRSAQAAGRDLGEPLTGTMTDGLYVNDVIRVGGQPAMVTVVPFAPHTRAEEMPGEPALLIGAQHMTEQVLDRLAALSHVENLRHVPASHAAVTGEHAHPITDALGNTVTHVTWQSSAPGYAILRAALPAIAVSLGLIALMTLLAAVTMRRLTRRLAESERAAVHASRHDAATGLANRGWFMRVFEELLAPADQRKATYAVLVIDCDYFKSVNDTLGHAAGDAVLAAVARRLKELGHKITIAARLGGDEFAVVTAPLTRAEDAAAHVRGIEEALSRSVVFDSYMIMVSVSIGAAVLETPSKLSIDAWLARADTALYRAKRDGRGCVRFYDADADVSGVPLLAGSVMRARDADRSNAA
jgi:diguanylate cyclase (GGDEF)-like protein